MIITLINPQGFCFGVNRALKIAYESKKKYQNLYIYNDLIHNRNVTNDLKKLNIKTEYHKENIKDNVIISAHGLSNEEINYFKNKNINIINSTCPLVLKVHKLIKKYQDLGYTIFYIGKNNHPESKAIIKNFKVYLITNINDIPILNTDKIFITNQTTLSILDIEDIYKVIKKNYPNCIISNDICNATVERQKAIINLEKQNVVLVVGDILSSNTVRLLEIAEKYHNKAYLINDYHDIDLKWFKKDDKVAITSGASTPSYLVNEVQIFLNNIFNS